MPDPSTQAGRDLLLQHPEVGADVVLAVEQQARGQGLAAASQRTHRVLDRLQSLLTVDQLSAASALLALDPDVISDVDDATLRQAIDGFVDPRRTGATPTEAREAGERYLNEIR
jgi:hypothetical protein